MRLDNRERTEVMRNNLPWILEKKEGKGPGPGQRSQLSVSEEPCNNHKKITITESIKQQYEISSYFSNS